MDDTQDTDPGIPPFEAAPGANASAGRSLDIGAMLGQLQGMISKVATASEPALREVAAKAAELAAVAGERAGPIAHSLADRTEEMGHSVAGKASGFASTMRSAAMRGQADEGDVPPDAIRVSEAPDVGDPAEDSQGDGA